MTVAEAALLVAILGVLLAAASLGWQVTAFVRGGNRVTCKLSMGAEIKEETPDGMATISRTLPAEEWSKSPTLRSEPGQRFIVEVTNTGRAPAYIASIAMATGHDTFALTRPANLGSLAPALPCVLDAGQTQRWQLPVADFSVMWKQPTGHHCVHAQATLGTGRKIVSEEGVTVALLKESDQAHARS